MDEDIEQRFKYLESILNELRDELAREQAHLLAKLDIIGKSMQEIQVIIFGEERYRLRGVGERLETLEKTMTSLDEHLRSIRLPERIVTLEGQVEAIEKERQSIKDQIEGALRAIRVAVAVAGTSGGGAILSFIYQLTK
jgi:DNA repair exonuclease SbcCD ATPase subunit